MGLGVIGNRDVTFKRSFRYTFEIEGFCGNGRVPEHFVQIAARPNLTIEETQIDHKNARTWIPGKAYWETISVTYYDVAHAEMAPLYKWLTTIYDFTSINRLQGTKDHWAATGILTMWDGCGFPIETWEMKNMFPTSCNFGTTDYSSSDISTIEMTLRYSDVTYRSEFTSSDQIGSCCEQDAAARFQ